MKARINIIKSIKTTVLSRLFMGVYTNNKNKYIVISICSGNDSSPKMCFDTNRLDVLKINVDDVDDVSYARKYNYKVFSENDAENVLNFVNKYINDIDEVVVHCDAGVSRSAGTAAALLKIYTGDDSLIFDSKKYLPNRHIYNTILKKAVDFGLLN